MITPPDHTALLLTFVPADQITYRSDEFDPEAGASLSVLVVGLCEQLHEAGCRFVVEACGVDWKTSVDWDLSSILGWVPTVIDELRRGEYNELYFFEQGLERKLLLRPTDDGDTEIQAISVSPNAEVIEGAVTETIVTDDLVQMLTDLCVGTANAIQDINPHLAAVDPLPLWRQGDPGPPSQRQWRLEAPKL